MTLNERVRSRHCRRQIRTTITIISTRETFSYQPRINLRIFSNHHGASRVFSATDVPVVWHWNKSLWTERISQTVVVTVLHDDCRKTWKTFYCVSMWICIVCLCRCDWKCGSGKCFTVKIARVENARVENAGVDSRGGKCRSGKCRSRQQRWKMQEYKSYGTPIREYIEKALSYFVILVLILLTE